MKRFVLASVIAAGLALPAQAGLDEGRAAYLRGDYATAIRELEPAANAGDPEAQNTLGLMYLHGYGVDVNEELAARYFRDASDRGSARAQANLAVMLALGQGVDLNPVQARMWLTVALTRGLDQTERTLAVINRDSLTRSMTPEEIAESDRLARAWVPLAERQRATEMAVVAPPAPAAPPPSLAAPTPQPRPVPAAPATAGDRVAPPPSYRPSVPAPAAAAAPATARSVPAPARAAAPAPSPATRPAAAAPAIAAAPPAPKPPPSYRVQLGLYNTETAALAEWNALKGRYQQQLGTLTLRVVPALVAKNRMRRLEAGPFKTRDEAEAACTSLRRAGQACVVLGS